MLRRSAVLAILILATVAAIALWRKSESPSPPSTTTLAEKGTAPAPKAEAVPEAKRKAGFSAEAQAEISRCLTRPAADFTELKSLLQRAGGTPTEQRLEWKLLHFEDAGKPFRVRLARDGQKNGRAELKVALFSVDEEGLPDPAPLPPELIASEQSLQSFTAEKRITKEMEERVFRFAEGAELKEEKEDGEITKLDFSSTGLRLACDASAGTPSCHCAR